MRKMITCLLMLWFVAGIGVAQDTNWVAMKSYSNEWLHDVHFINQYTGFAVGENGAILKSTNQGFTWAAESSGTVEQLHSIDFIDSLTGLAVGGCSSCGGGIILKTTDAGNHWIMKDGGHALNAVKYTSHTRGWAVGCDGLVLQSTDAGETWSQVVVPDIFSCLETISFIGDSTGWIGGYIPGVLLKTTDAGGTWTSLSDSIDPQQDIDGLYFLDKQKGWLVGFGFTETSTVGVIKATTNGGATWEPQVSGITDALLSVAFADAQNGWAVSSAGSILRTGDAGAHWAAEPSPSSGGLDRIEVRAGEGAWTVGLDGTILRKNLGGLAPQRLVSLLAGWNIVSVPMAVVNASPSAIYPGAASQAFSYTPDVGYNTGTVLNNGIGYWLKLPSDRDYVETGTVLDSLTVNLPASWNLVGGISDDIPVGNVKQNPPGSVVSIFSYTGSTYTAPSTLEHGKGFWIKCSQACALTFYRVVPAGMPSAMMTSTLKLRTDELPPPAPGEPAGARVATGSAPTSFALHQNYPNPFNPSTTISFDVPEESEVSLVIYNLLGEQIATIASGLRGAGTYAYQWNAAGELPSGVYLFKMTGVSQTSAKTFVEVRKMMLMK